MLYILSIMVASTSTARAESDAERDAREDSEYGGQSTIAQNGDDDRRHVPLYLAPNGSVYCLLRLASTTWARTFRMQVDTGSRTSWLPRARCAVAAVEPRTGGARLPVSSSTIEALRAGKRTLRQLSFDALAPKGPNIALVDGVPTATVAYADGQRVSGPGHRRLFVEWPARARSGSPEAELELTLRVLLADRVEETVPAEYARLPHDGLLALAPGADRADDAHADVHGDGLPSLDFAVRLAPGARARRAAAARAGARGACSSPDAPAGALLLLPPPAAAGRPPKGAVLINTAAKTAGRRWTVAAARPALVVRAVAASSPHVGSGAACSAPDAAELAREPVAIAGQQAAQEVTHPVLAELDTGTTHVVVPDATHAAITGAAARLAADVHAAAAVAAHAAVARLATAGVGEADFPTCLELEVVDDRGDARRLAFRVGDARAERADAAAAGGADRLRVAIADVRGKGGGVRRRKEAAATPEKWVLGVPFFDSFFEVRFLRGADSARPAVALTALPPPPDRTMHDEL